MSGTPLESRSKIFVSRALEGLGGSDPLLPLKQHHEVDIWSDSKPPSPEQLVARARGCQGLLCLLTDRIDKRFVQACPDLRVISSISVGVDHIDVPAARRAGIQVGHTPGVLAETTADLTFALLLAAARRIPEADRFVREGHWTAERQWEPDLLLGRDVHGAVLGVIGLGDIGQAVAARGQGFGMQVLAWTRSGRSVPGVESVSMDELLGRADFVCVHVARTADTEGLLGAEEIGRCKQGAVLVNTARGGIVDEAALAEALTTGHLFAAALDVFANEPLEPDSPLRAVPNLVLAPHIGSASVATRRRMAALAVENLLAGLRGESMPHAVA